VRHTTAWSEVQVLMRRRGRLEELSECSMVSALRLPDWPLAPLASSAHEDVLRQTIPTVVVSLPGLLSELVNERMTGAQDPR